MNKDPLFDYRPAEDWQMAPRPMVRSCDRVIGYLIQKPTGAREIVCPLLAEQPVELPLDPLEDDG